MAVWTTVPSSSPSTMVPSPPMIGTRAPTGGGRGTSRGSSPSSGLSPSLLWASAAGSSIPSTAKAVTGSEARAA
eukprot:9159343-Lingulodinium_polyedra.AAC.1